jgi:hypothetical protein
MQALALATPLQPRLAARAPQPHVPVVPLQNNVPQHWQESLQLAPVSPQQ